MFTPVAVAVLHLADALSGDSAHLDESLVDELRAQFSDEELAELILVAGQANLNNRAGNAAKQLLRSSDERSDSSARR